MCGLPRRTGAPATATVPVVTGISPNSTLSRLVFPDPLGPSTATNSPRSTASVSPDQMVRAPNARPASSSCTAGPM